MNEFVTVANLLNGLMLLVGWSIRNELHHIRKDIIEAKSFASKAHERIDELLMTKSQ